MRAWTGDRLAAVLWAVIAAAPLAAGVAARGLLSAAPRRLTVDLAQPLVVVTAWGGYGACFFLLLAAAVAAGALALGVLCLRAARQGGDLPGGRSGTATILLCAALALAGALSWPCVFSSDVYAYAAYGDQVLRGQNPYVAPPPGTHDAFLDAARWQWTRTSFPPCVYGPLFVGLGAATVLLGGMQVAPALWLLRLAACGAFLSAILLFDAALAGRPRRQIAVALLALNPVALWSAAEGHNDTLVLAAVLGAVVAARRGKPVLAAALVGLSPLIKAVGLLAGPPMWALQPSARRARFGAALVAAGAATALVLLPLQLGGLRTLGRHGHYAPEYSLQGLVGVVPGLLLGGALVLAALPDLRRGRFGGVVRLALGVWLALPNAYPWYALWVLPVAAAGLGTWEAAALLGVTISVVLRYLPEAFGPLGGVPGALLALGELLPAAVALAALFRPPAAQEATSA